MGRSRLANLPERFAAGAYVLSSGLAKLQPDRARAVTLYEATSSTHVLAEERPAEGLTKLLGVAECAVGGTLLLPLIGDGLAGLSLSAVAGGLLALHLQTPALYQEGGVRPSQEGTVVGGDVVLLGVGLSLLSHSVGARRRTRKAERATRSARASSGGAGGATTAASAAVGR